MLKHVQIFTFTFLQETNFKSHYLTFSKFNNVKKLKKLPEKVNVFASIFKKFTQVAF